MNLLLTFETVVEKLLAQVLQQEKSSAATSASNSGRSWISSFFMNKDKWHYIVLWYSMKCENAKNSHHLPKATTGSMHVAHFQWYLDEFCNPRPHRQQRQNLLWCKFEFAVILVASARGFHRKSNVDIKYPFRGEATIWKLKFGITPACSSDLKIDN